MKSEWKYKQYKYKKINFKNGSCKIAAILFWPQYVKQFSYLESHSDVGPRRRWYQRQGLRLHHATRGHSQHLLLLQHPRVEGATIGQHGLLLCQCLLLQQRLLWHHHHRRATHSLLWCRRLRWGHIEPFCGASLWHRTPGRYRDLWWTGWHGR